MSHLMCAVVLVALVAACNLAIWSFDQLGRKFSIISDFAQNQDSKHMHVWDYPGAEAQGIKPGRRIVVVRAAEPFAALIGFDLVMPWWYLLGMLLLWRTTIPRLRGSHVRPFYDPTGFARSVPDPAGGGHVACFSMWVGQSAFLHRVITDREVTIAICTADKSQHYTAQCSVPSHWYVKYLGWYN